MKRSLKKLVCLVLTVLLVTLTLAPFALAGAAYPQGVTKEQSLEAIEKTDTVLYTLVKQSQGKTLKELVTPMLYSSDTLSALTLGIYSALEENSEDISAVGIDLSVAGVAQRLTAYPEVYNALIQYNSWSEVKLENVNWGVNDKATFSYGAGAVLSPFNDLLYALLCGGSYSINSVIGIKGDKGYETAIIPTLKALGCESITDAATYYADADADKNTMVANLIGDIMTLMEAILDAPCDTLTDILPGIAVFLTQGGFDDAISTLIEPLRLQIFNISTIFKVQSILNFISDSESFTQGFTLNINDIMGETGLKLAEIDLEGIASCGTVSGDTVVSDKADTFIYLLRFVIDTLKLNTDSLSSLGEGMEDMGDMLKSITSKPTDDIMKMLFDILCATGGKVNDFQWTFPEFTAGQVTYTANLGADKYQRVVDGIDELLDEFVREGGEYDSLGEMLKKEIYSNALVSELACGIYGMLGSEDMAALGGVIDLPTTPYALASHLSGNQFYYTRRALYNYGSFEGINTSKLTWGFRNGDKEGFIKAVCAVLSPLEEALNMLLCEGKLEILGCIDLYGSDGYNTAVIPLLEALGCSTDSIKTYDEYKALAEKGKATQALLESLCSLIDRIIEKPVYTILEILPNLMYNLNGGLIETAMENLMYPFTELLSGLGMEDMLDMSQLGDMDITSLLGDMGGDMGFDLSGLDLEGIASFGTAITVQSKRTSGGQSVSVTYIQADKPAEIVTILRFFVELMKAPGNEDMLTGFMSGSGDGNDMFATFSGGITDELSAMTTDETVEWLYKLFFRERAVVEETPVEDYLPTVIYVDENTNKNEGAGIYFFLLLVAAAEIVLMKKRNKIESYFEYKKLKKLADAQENNQEV